MSPDEIITIFIIVAIVGFLAWQVYKNEGATIYNQIIYLIKSIGSIGSNVASTAKS